MLAEPWIHVTTYVVLGVIAGVLGVTLIASLIAERRERQTHALSVFRVRVPQFFPKRQRVQPHRRSSER
jgi:hypothetical protein